MTLEPWIAVWQTVQLRYLTFAWLWNVGVFGALLADRTVTFHAKLTHRAAVKHLRVAGAVRRVAGGTALGLKRGMFENERPVLVGVAFDT